MYRLTEVLATSKDPQVLSSMSSECDVGSQNVVLGAFG